MPDRGVHIISDRFSCRIGVFTLYRIGFHAGWGCSHYIGQVFMPDRGVHIISDRSSCRIGVFSLYRIGFHAG